jgi:hypothetical protein
MAEFSQGVAEGLMQQGLTQLGSISAIGKRGPVAEAIVGAAQDTAMRAVQAMRTRYWQEEYKQFSQAYIEPSKANMEMIAQQFEAETKVANRIIAFPRSQGQLQVEANEAVKNAPGPETDAKKAGPAGMEPAGIGQFEYDERPAMLGEGGQPIQMGTMEANEHIRASMSKALSGQQAITMKLMDAFAEFPNNPIVQQAAGKMFENMQQQLAFAATGKTDAMEAGRYMDERAMHEAEVEERAANTAGMRQEQANVKDQEIGNQRAQVSLAARLMDAGYGEYYGEKLQKAMQGDWEDFTPEQMNELGAINNVAQEAYNKQVEAGLEEQKASQFMHSGKTVATESFPAQLRSSKRYQQFLGEVMQPVMPEYIEAWNANIDGTYRKSIGAPAHLLTEDASDNRVTDFLLQHASATHPGIVAEAEKKTFDFAYQTDIKFARRIDSEIEDDRRAMMMDGEWSELRERIWNDPEGRRRILRAQGRQREFFTDLPKDQWDQLSEREKQAVVDRAFIEDPDLHRFISGWNTQQPTQQPTQDLPQGGTGMLLSHMAPALPLKAKPKAKPAGPAHEWLKSKIGTGHPASQETNTPTPKRTVTPHTKLTQSTDTKDKKAKKVDKPAAQGSQSTDSKKSAKPGSPRLQVKKLGSTGYSGRGLGGGLEAPPKYSTPPSTLGKVEIDRSRLRQAIAVPSSVKSLEDFIKDLGGSTDKALGAVGKWWESHQGQEKKYKSRHDLTAGK